MRVFRLFFVVGIALLMCPLAQAKSVRCSQKDGSFSAVQTFNSAKPFFEETLTIDGDSVVNTLVDQRVVCLERREDIDTCQASEQNSGGRYEFVYDCGPRARFSIMLLPNGTGVATCFSAFFPNDRRELANCR